MARPRGETRQALCRAADRLAETRGRFTGRDVASHAQVGWDTARRTVQKMVCAGELVLVGKAHGACKGRPPHLYARPDREHRVGRTWPAADLLQVVRRWASIA